MCSSTNNKELTLESNAERFSRNKDYLLSFKRFRVLKNRLVRKAVHFSAESKRYLKNTDNVLSLLLSMFIAQSLCLYHNLYIYTTISMFIPQSLCLYHTLYAYNNLNAYTTISMLTLQSQCLYKNLYGYTTTSCHFPLCCITTSLNDSTISMFIPQSLYLYHNLYIYTTFSMFIPQSLCL